MKKITMDFGENIKDLFSLFLAAKSAAGAVEKTLQTYQAHLLAIGKHLDIQKQIGELSQKDLNAMFASMRGSGLAPNSIKSYSITLRAFLNWCNAEGWTSLKCKAYKGEDIIKETYSKEELMLLLKKPNVRACGFSEYRNWVIVNFLINSGCRAGTLRNIQIGDVDFDNAIVIARHTKNKKPLVIPLCSDLVNILKEYLTFRQGKPTDFLFCNTTGEMLTENNLRKQICAYNRSRGVEKTSIHLFRHTFAKIFLQECNGDAFTLQKILGHSTLQMTKHYCAIFDAEIANNYDARSPLAMLHQNNSRIKMKRHR